MSTETLCSPQPHVHSTVNICPQLLGGNYTFGVVEVKPVLVLALCWNLIYERMMFSVTTVFSILSEVGEEGMSRRTKRKNKRVREEEKHTLCSGGRGTGGINLHFIMSENVIHL